MTYNSPEIILLSNSTLMISMIDSIAIGVETPMIDSICSLKKEFI